MLTLAIEHSTAHGSAALLDGERVLTNAEWLDASPGERQLGTAVDNVLRRAARRLADIDLFAVGVGPGAYTNLRTALSMVRGFAAPGEKPVRAVCSARALAWDLATDEGVEHTTVVGNARRERIWLMQFDTAHGAVCLRTGLTLIDPRRLREHRADTDVVITADWAALGATLQDLELPVGRLIEREYAPRAHSIARLAIAAHTATPDAPDLPLVPIYIHPPVSATPRCPPSRRKAAAV